MYRSNYKSLFRCHTLTECVNYALDPNITKTDLFLYLLDTYDILLSHADGSMILDENDDVPYLRLANKLEIYQLCLHVITTCFLNTTAICLRCCNSQFQKTSW